MHLFISRVAVFHGVCCNFSMKKTFKLKLPATLATRTDSTVKGMLIPLSKVDGIFSKNSGYRHRF